MKSAPTVAMLLAVGALFMSDGADTSVVSDDIAAASTGTAPRLFGRRVVAVPLALLVTMGLYLLGAWWLPDKYVSPVYALAIAVPSIVVGIAAWTWLVRGRSRPGWVVPGVGLGLVGWWWALGCVAVGEDQYANPVSVWLAASAGWLLLVGVGWWAVVTSRRVLAGVLVGTMLVLVGVPSGWLAFRSAQMAPPGGTLEACLYGDEMEPRTVEVRSPSSVSVYTGGLVPVENVRLVDQGCD